jgi:hypothetical protein
MYLINSSLRTGENLLVETMNTTLSNTGNISCVNTLLADKKVMTHMFNDFLSNITGEIFNTSLSSSNKMVLNSKTCYFKLDNSNNINTYYPYNLLGFNSSILPNTFYNTITGSNEINLNTPIFESNIFQLDILKTYSERTFQIYQPNFVIQNLCKLIQDKLTINTNLSWTVIYDNILNRVTISLMSNNVNLPDGFSSIAVPVNGFKFFWTDSKMVHIANALGFTEQSEFIYESITATNPPLIDTILSNNDIIVLNTEKANFATNTNLKEFSPRTFNADQFINTLADQLSTETNMNVIVTINNNNKITIKFVPKNNSFYVIKILFSSQNMVNIANVLGFPEIDIERISLLDVSFVGSYQVDFDRILLPNDLFKIQINEISFDTKSYDFYNIPLNLPIYNPKECIDQINKKLMDTTAKPWSISSNIGTTINNNSYLKMNLYDTDTSFRMLWGNVNTGNISKSMGFDNIDNTDFVNTIVSGNIIDFNYNLNYTDQLNYEIKSNIYYKLDDFIIQTNSEEHKLNEYILSLPKKLENVSGKKYSVYFQESTQKIYISVGDMNTTFKILFGHPSMKNIAKMLGFNPVNTPKYVSSLVSDNIVDYTIELNVEDIFFMIQKNNNYDFSTLNTISFNQSYFSSETFINNLQDILTTKTNKSWTVSQSSNNLTLQVNSPNCAFQFLWGDPAMEDVSTALGFDAINPTTFLTTTTSNNNVNRFIQFNNKDQFIFKFRDTTPTYTTPKPYLYNVPTNLYNSQKFIKSLALILYNLTNKIFEVIYDTNTQKITIQIDSSNSYFKIQWQLPSMNLIGQMMGFSNTETSDYTVSTTGQNAADLNIQLNDSSTFSISIVEKTNINYDSFTNKYMLYIDPNFFYPDYFFQYMSSLINKDLVYPLTFVYNQSTRKLTISSINKFQIDFANMENLAKVLGFNFMVSPTYELSYTGVNQIDMTLRILPTDLFRVRFCKV